MYIDYMHTYTLYTRKLSSYVSVMDGYMENCSWDKMTAATIYNNAFVEKTPLYFTAHVMLKPLISLVGCVHVIARDGRLELTDRHTHSHTQIRPSIVTLSVHVHRGLIMTKLVPVSTQRIQNRVISQIFN